VIWVLAIALAGAAPCEEATHLRAGELAPCDAILVPHEWATKCTLCLAVDLPECQANKAHLEASNTLALDTLKLELKAERELTAELHILLENPPRPPLRWYEHPAFWGTVGAVVGLSVGVGLATR
jgi:hypothetical protein